MSLPSCIFSTKIYSTQVVEDDNPDYRDYHMTVPTRDLEGKKQCFYKTIYFNKAICFKLKKKRPGGKTPPLS